MNVYKRLSDKVSKEMDTLQMNIKRAAETYEESLLSLLIIQNQFVSLKDQADGSITKDGEFINSLITMQSNQFNIIDANKKVLEHLLIQYRCYILHNIMNSVDNNEEKSIYFLNPILGVIREKDSIPHTSFNRNFVNVHILANEEIFNWLSENAKNRYNNCYLL